MINKTSNFIYDKSIAIMGGTFDPIHFGHLMAAEYVRKKFHIKKVIFVPCGRPPHKENKNILDRNLRYIMTELATLSNKNFEVSPIEVRREGISYTVDTIDEIKKFYSPDTKLYFITGADALEKISTWKQLPKLLSMCEFIGVTRPGYDKKSLVEAINKVEVEYKRKLHFIEIPGLSISSTQIRNNIENNESVKYLLPEEVENYIYKYGLYKKGTIKKDLNYNEIYKMLRSNLSEKRYTHTMGVGEEAVNLAKAYNEDEDKAYIAALFHDSAKEIKDTKKLELCKEYGIKLDTIMKQQISLSHGFLGAEIARRFFRVEDKDILNAIRYHTTGRKNMSKLEKIIFVADVIEPNRKFNKDMQLLRTVAYKDLDKAVLICLKNVLELSMTKKVMFHPLGIEALEYMHKTMGN